MSIIDTLITDRTEKGHYEIEDLNRVGEAMQYVAARLCSCGWDVAVDPRTDWKWTDRVTLAEAQRYLRNLQKIRNALVPFPSTPSVPSGAAPCTAKEANDIEKILQDVDELITKMAAAWFYCGEVYTGEV